MIFSLGQIFRERENNNNIEPTQPSSWSKAATFFLEKGKREKFKSRVLKYFPLNFVIPVKWAIILLEN